MRPGPEKGPWPGEAIGRSRGGLTTKIHLACDGQGRPLAFTITAGNINDRTQFEHVMARISISRCGPGRPRTRPERVAADKGYSFMKIRSYPRGRGIKAAIPEPIDQINGHTRRSERRCRLDRAAYRRRNVVERCFNRLKHNKALATRYDKRARHYQAPGHPRLPTTVAAPTLRTRPRRPTVRSSRRPHGRCAPAAGGRRPTRTRSSRPSRSRSR
ncbi:hypothetical protein GCM10009680_57980 [Streptomyces yatensis]|uniref:Transposase IS4-like domain-containing protein n=1 Tax=Streptomyces yatensis TaxID=155177 RepID=A0ABN2IQ89_9ACTN